MPLDEWNLTIGVVVSTFGRIGELKVHLETDYPERFADLKEVCLRPNKGDARMFTMDRARLHKKQILLKLEGVNNISDAELWRGARVQVRRDKAVPLPEGSYYVGDLIGMEVVTLTGRSLGLLEKILPYPAQDLLQVGDALIPAVREIIHSVDTEARRITINPPPGLLPGEEPEIADEPENTSRSLKGEPRSKRKRKSQKPDGDNAD